VDISEYLKDNDDGMVGRLGEALGLHRCVKWYATMDIAFYRTTSDGESQRTTGRFRTQPILTSDASELSANHMIGDFLRAIEAFNRLGSQWLVDYIFDFSITLAPFRPHSDPVTFRHPTHRRKEMCRQRAESRRPVMLSLLDFGSHPPR